MSTPIDPNPAPSATQTNRAALVRQTRIWVNQTMFGTLMKQIRESPFRSELFSGGRGGQAFGSLLDQHLMQRMGGSGPGERLVNSIVRRIERAHPHLFREEHNDPFGELKANVRTHVTPGAGN